jgi:hypothetical protein
MKFLYSDTQDYVDPGYDFINDRNAPGRKRYWDDRYAHEIMDTPPYDGLLVSISAVKPASGVGATKGRYSTAEQHRFLRDGARKFLRFNGAKFADKILMGDCGAFAYATQETPAYAPQEVVEFYADAGFTHGCAPDHIIFDCDLANPPRNSVSADVLARYEVTLENANRFRKLALQDRTPFEPVGPIQGWSPASMGEAAKNLEAMGYRYLAVGGLVPLRVEAIHACLRAIRSSINTSTSLHLLGFAKAEQIGQFVQYGIESFDSTSPLIRAFKDAKANYYLEAPGGGLEYFTAIRVPQAIENPRLMQAIKKGSLSPEDLQQKENQALAALRAFDRNELSVGATVDNVAQYQELLLTAAQLADAKRAKEMSIQRQRLTRTLEARPWNRCRCAICREIGIDVIIFRSSNRNKRRGIHNLGVYYNHLKRTLGARV